MTKQLTKEEKVGRSYYRLTRHAEAYCASFNEQCQNDSYHITFDCTAIINIAESAVVDIERFKDYHLARFPGEEQPDTALRTDLADAVKRAAFYVKWISKIKPIRPVNEVKIAENKEDSFKAAQMMEANAGFSIAVGSDCLSDDNRVTDDLWFVTQIEQELIYVLTFREVSADALLLFFQTVFTSAVAGNIIE